MRMRNRRQSQSDQAQCCLQSDAGVGIDSLMELIDWNRGLLHGSALVVIGAMAIVAGRSVRDRLFSVGILTQGIAIFLVAGGTFFSRTDFDVLAAVILVVACLWCVWMIPLRSAASAQVPASPPAVDEPKEPA